MEYETHFKTNGPKILRYIYLPDSHILGILFIDPWSIYEQDEYIILYSSNRYLHTLYLQTKDDHWKAQEMLMHDCIHICGVSCSKYKFDSIVTIFLIAKL